MSGPYSPEMSRCVVQCFAGWRCVFLGVVGSHAWVFGVAVSLCVNFGRGRVRVQGSDKTRPTLHPEWDCRVRTSGLQAPTDLVAPFCLMTSMGSRCPRFATSSLFPEIFHSYPLEDLGGLWAAAWMGSEDGGWRRGGKGEVKMDEDGERQ